MAYVNVFLLGAGANVWGKGTLYAGWVSALIAVPVFLYRHQVTDKGQFPRHMFSDLIPEGILARLDAADAEQDRAGPSPHWPRSSLSASRGRSAKCRRRCRRWWRHGRTPTRSGAPQLADDEQFVGRGDRARLPR